MVDIIRRWWWGGWTPPLSENFGWGFGNGLLENVLVGKTLDWLMEVEIWRNMCWMI